jgi:hypothetical protein
MPAAGKKSYERRATSRKLQAASQEPESQFWKFCCMLTAQSRSAFQTTDGLRRCFCVAAVPGLKPGVTHM